MYRVLVLVIAVLAVAPGASGAPKQPIEGTWAWATGGGSVRISATGPDTFVGTVVSKASGDCGEAAKPGFKRWLINGTGTSYTGAFAQINSCKRAPVDGQATWTVTTQASKNRLVFCMTKSGEPPGMTFDPPFCSELIPVRATDTEAPAVKALPSEGAPGSTVKLLYNVADDSARARERLIVRKGSAVLFQTQTKLHPVLKTMKFSGGFFYRWPSGTAVGKLTLCVQAWDAAGNASPVRCAPLTIR